MSVEELYTEGVNGSEISFESTTYLVGMLRASSMIFTNHKERTFMFKRTALAIASIVFISNASAAVVGIGGNNWYTDTLRQNLIAQGNTVTVYTSYDAATLAGLDAYIQDGNNFFDANLLDSFVFNGGTLIEIPWTFTHNGYTAGTKVFSGRTFADHGSNLFTHTIDANDWLLDGVTVPASLFGGHEVGNTFQAGVHQVLDYTDGTAMLGYKEYGQGIAIGFNLHLVTSDASPVNAAWSNQIVYNAIAGNNSVPEPAPLALIALGLAGIALAKRRKA